MNCRSAEQAMDRALDEAIPSALKGELETHLARCPGCRRQWDALQAAEAVLRVPRPVQAPEDLLADFRRRLEAEQPVAPRTPARPRLSWLWPTGSIAAAGLAAALAVTFNLPGTFDGPKSPKVSPSPGGGGSAVPAVTAPLAESTAKPPSSSTSSSPSSPGSAGASSSLAAGPRAKHRAKGLAQAAKPQATRSTARVAPPLAEQELATVEKQTDKSVRSELPKQRPTGVTAEVGRRLEREKQLNAGVVSSRAVESLAEPRAAAEEKAVLPRNSAGKVDALARAPQNPAAEGSARYFRGARGDGSEPQGQKGAIADRSVSDSERLAPSAQGERPNGKVVLGFGVNVRALPLNDGRGKVANFYYQDVEKLEPRELDVSPAVLTALQRPVEVALRGETVAGAVRQLTEAADVVLSVDPRIAGVTVNVETTGPQAPLWVVLQEMAQQGNLQILPQENRLELRPAAPSPAKPRERMSLAAPADAPPAGPSVLDARPPAGRGNAPAPPAAAPTPTPAPSGALGIERSRRELQPAPKTRKQPLVGERGIAPDFKPVRPEAKKAPSAYKLAEKAATAKSVTERAPAEAEVRVAAAPDRRVWPDQWGRLPEWGFILPGPEGLPAESAEQKAKVAVPSKARLPVQVQPQSKTKRSRRK